MRLLLAEDEKMLSEALVAILEHSHYSVDPVYNGLDAYDYLRTGNYDGAILDIMMPKMDGVTVLKKIRSEGITIPVLLLTAKSEIDDRVEGLDAGADDYLTKPFDSKELLARIRSMLRRQPEMNLNDLTFSDLTLNRTGFTVQGPGGTEKLSNKEFQMLELMMQRPGYAISAELFLEKIWGFETESDVNVVWVTLSGLRKKLAKLDSSVQIKANRGIGYLLKENDA